MSFVIKNKIIRIIKNPVFAIGLILMMTFVYMQCSKYLDIHYLSADSQLKPVELDMMGDVDVMDGYIPMTTEEKYMHRMTVLLDNLIKNVGMDEGKANEIINAAIKMERKDAINYLKKKLPFVSNLSSYFNSPTDMKFGTAKEVNEYISKALAKENFMDYFGRKYVDYLGIIFVFFCIIFYPFYFASDSKKDIYELLHTKPISSRKYILSQVLGAILTGFLAVVIITFVTQSFLFMNKEKFDFAVNTMRIWKYTLWCLFPTIIYISAVFLLLSIVFKSPIPAIPLIFAQIIYSNAGVTSSNGAFTFIHRPGAIVIRYPKQFFETHLSDSFYVNQIGLIVLGVIIIMLAAVLWEKKRV